MNDFSFSTLNDQEFEVLVRDLLNAKFTWDLQSFRRGPDKGIDLRQPSATNDNATVVQVKHYYRSGIELLKRDLKSKELPKVDKLKPDRYIVATSLPLSPQHQEAIRELMSPHVRSIDDVIGKEDLNRYLSDFPEIEKRHFKLWFSSISLLSRIVNSAVETRTKYLLDRVVAKFPRCVVTHRLEEANRILDKEKVLLITGQPGIGKTTLAEIIIFERYKMGLEIHEVADVPEAEKMISVDDEKRQLFYMDDFLGDIHMELVSGETPGEISKFVDRIRNTPNKYLLLTSRTVIVQSAIERFEKLRRSRLSEEQFELKLMDYSDLEKARILYNHIYFSEVGEEHCRAIVDNKFYKTIISHANFVPRLIEFITNSKRIGSKTAEEYRDFITENLDNPSEIWRDSFYNQISYFDRCFLYTLFTFAGECDEEDLRKAFDERMRYEKEQNAHRLTSNDFHKCVRDLLNGFITSYRDEDSRSYQLINPSLADFMDAELSNSIGELAAVANTIISYQQVSHFEHGHVAPKEIQEIFLRRILIDEIDLQRIVLPLPNYPITLKLEWLSKLCPALNLDEIFVELLSQMDLEESFHYFGPVLDYITKKKKRIPLSFEFIRTHFLTIIEHVVDDISNDVDAVDVPDMFDTYGYDFTQYSLTEDGSDQLIDLLQRATDDTYNDLISNRETDFFDIEDAEENFDKVATSYYSLEKVLFPEGCPYIVSNLPPSFNRKNWETIVEENRKRSSLDNDYERHYEQPNPSSNPESAIEGLFDRLTERLS